MKKKTGRVEFSLKIIDMLLINKNTNHNGLNSIAECSYLGKVNAPMSLFAISQKEKLYALITDF